MRGTAKNTTWLHRLKSAWKALCGPASDSGPSRDALLNALESSYDGFSVFDADDRLVVYNRRYLEIYPTIVDIIRPGVSFEELLRVSAARGQYAGVAPDDYGAWLAERLQRHNVPSDPFEQWLSDGRCLEILERPTPDGGRVAIRRDITHRKQAELELQRKLEFEQTLMDALPFPVFYKDREGIYLGCNQAFAHMLGRRREDVVGRSLTETHAPEKAAEFKRRDEELFARGGIQTYETDIRWGGPQADFRRVSTVKGTFLGPDGSVSGLIGSVIDLTLQKQAEEQLVQTAKLATLGQIASEVAHEMNQPLSILRMTAENCRERIRSADMSAELLERKLVVMTEQAERMSEMIARLRSFGKPDAVEKIAFDPEKAVHAALRKTANRMLTDGIDFTPSLPVHWPQLHGQPAQLTEALENLLINACDAVDDAHPRGERKVFLNVLADVSGLRLIVEDNGGGVPEEAWPRLFTPFFTTKTNVAAAGLGLSAAATMVHGLGGRITGRNGADGAVFEIELPSWDGDDASHAPPPSEPLRADDKDRPNILVVDDEPLAVDCVEDFLNNRGYAVLPAVGPAEALDFARTHRIDLVITDQRMPGMDGATLLKKLRLLLPGLPAILVSGGTVPAPPTDEGRTQVMTKPLILGELHQAIGDMLNRRASSPATSSPAAPSPTAAPAEPPASTTSLDGVSRLWLTGDVAAALAHDFSQPLNVIRLNMENTADSLESGGVDDHALRRALKSTIEQSKRMRAAADKIVAVCRRPRRPPQRFSPIQAVRDALAEVQDHIRMRGINLIWRPEIDSPPVLGHPVRLGGAVAELLKNACDALAAAAIMHVADESQNWEARLDVACRRGIDGGIEIVIRDNGPGMPPEIWRAALAGETGNGLGLSVALGVIAEMNGSAEMTNSGDGTAITIRLPAAKPRLYRPNSALDAAEWENAASPEHAEAALLPLAADDDWNRLRDLAQKMPELPIIVLCAQNADTLRKAVLFGAAAALPKDAGEHDILCALHDCGAI